MKIFTSYSQSHKILFDNYFLPSFNKYLKNDFDLVVKILKQKTKNGSFKESGWQKTLGDKLLGIIELLESEKKPIIVADCDIQFFNNFKNDLLNKVPELEMCFLNDTGFQPMCCGFYYSNYSRSTLKLLNETHRNLINTLTNHKGGEQSLFHKTYKRFPVKVGLFGNKYFNVAQVTGPKVWDGEDFNVPRNIFLHHANWTVGIKNKVKLLDYVKNKLEL